MSDERIPCAGRPLLLQQRLQLLLLQPVGIPRRRRDPEPGRAGIRGGGGGKWPQKVKSSIFLQKGDFGPKMVEYGENG